MCSLGSFVAGADQVACKKSPTVASFYVPSKCNHTEVFWLKLLYNAHAHKSAICIIYLYLVAASCVLKISIDGG